MMGHKGLTKAYDEDDVLTRECRLDRPSCGARYRAGIRKSYKKTFNRRVRRQINQMKLSDLVLL